MRIAICDDERTLTETAAALAERWSRDRGVPCAVRTFSSGRQLLFETAGSYPFDLLLLDIDLGEEGLSGLDVARRVRETDRNTAIAFLTSHPEHVFAGYEVSALRYLMKPVAEADLFPLLDLVRESGERERRFLVLEVDGEQRRVEEEDILCPGPHGGSGDRVRPGGGADHSLRPLQTAGARLRRRPPELSGEPAPCGAGGTGGVPAGGRTDRPRQPGGLGGAEPRVPRLLQGGVT